MKARVLIEFKDKNTGKMRKVGEVFTCTKKRFSEIESVMEGLVEEYVEEPDVSDE